MAGLFAKDGAGTAGQGELDHVIVALMPGFEAAVRMSGAPDADGARAGD